jgi:hypothetical protein
MVISSRNVSPGEQARVGEGCGDGDPGADSRLDDGVWLETIEGLSLVGGI